MSTPQIFAYAHVNLSSPLVSAHSLCPVSSSHLPLPNGPAQASTRMRVEAFPGSDRQNLQSWDLQDPGKGKAGWGLRDQKDLVSHLTHREAQRGLGGRLGGESHTQTHTGLGWSHSKSLGHLPPAQSLTWTQLPEPRSWGRRVQGQE